MLLCPSLFPSSCGPINVRPAVTSLGVFRHSGGTSTPVYGPQSTDVLTHTTRAWMGVLRGGARRSPWVRGRSQRGGGKNRGRGRGREGQQWAGTSPMPSADVILFLFRPPPRRWGGGGRNRLCLSLCSSTEAGKCQQNLQPILHPSHRIARVESNAKFEPKTIEVNSNRPHMKLHISLV